MDKIKIKPRLKQDYQLSNYCPTEGNYIAVQAAKTVISEWGKSWFNPLLLLGPTGCGKTHLLHAIGNEILKNSPDICVLYVCALEYKNMYMDAIRVNRLADFESYYEKVDVLLFDDIQDLTGQGCQSLLLKTLNHFQLNGKQVVLTSNTDVCEMEKNIEARLLSHCRWGLSVEMSGITDADRRGIVEYYAPDFPKSVKGYLSKLPLEDVGLFKGIITSIKARCAKTRNDIRVAKNVVALILGTNEKGNVIDDVQESTE